MRIKAQVPVHGAPEAMLAAFKSKVGLPVSAPGSTRGGTLVGAELTEEGNIQLTVSVPDPVAQQLGLLTEPRVCSVRSGAPLRRRQPEANYRAWARELVAAGESPAVSAAVLHRYAYRVLGVKLRRPVADEVYRRLRADLASALGSWTRGASERLVGDSGVVWVVEVDEKQPEGFVRAVLSVDEAKEMDS